MTESDVDTKKFESLGELLAAIGSKKRLQSFILLAAGKTTSEVTEEIDISRSGLQNYINDFKDLGLIGKEGRSLVLTETGEWLEEQLYELERGYSEFLQDELMAEFEGIGGFASPGGRGFIQRLFEEHPEEAREVLEEYNFDVEDLDQVNSS